jgi:tryptophanyl-tRNA synthetase
VIRSKVKKAKTDSGPTEPDTPMPDYIKNLFQLMKLVSDESTVKKFKDDYKHATIRYGDMKKQLGEDMVNFVRPIREKAEAIRNDEAYLQKVMKEGAEKARSSARETIKLVKEAMGFSY